MMGMGGAACVIWYTITHRHGTVKITLASGCNKAILIGTNKKGPRLTSGTLLNQPVIGAPV
jgi:hypothetical protein